MVIKAEAMPAMGRPKGRALKRIKRTIPVRRCAALIAVGLIIAIQTWAAQAADPIVRNDGFEIVDPATGFAEGWRADISGGADAEVSLDGRHGHSESPCIRIVNRSPVKANVYASFFQPDIAVEAETTYEVSFYARGLHAQRCFVSAGFDSGGERRLYLAQGDFDWRPFVCAFTTPKGASRVTLRFASDDTTEGFWVDDVSLRRSDKQWANLSEYREKRPFSGVFPRPAKQPAIPLIVYDCSKDPGDIQRLAAVLQGIVNRRQPRLYLVNATNPAGYDEVWLAWLRERGYVRGEDRIPSFPLLLERFRGEIAGAVVFDPGLPGTIQAACMLGGIENALPATVEWAEALRLPVVMDLRGRWTRNVDAYRELRERYWDRFNHHVLAWMYPDSTAHAARDYLAAFNVFTFWVSSYADNDPGGDPAAEEAFVNELLASTPANIPVMGWPMYADCLGITEYEGVRWLSEYGKFVPGAEFCSNLTVHSAIRPKSGVIRQRFPANPTPPDWDPGAIYLSVNILDSGDNLWYWQFHQRKIWTDPARGSVPVGWCMNVTLRDMLPAVLEWYVEQATPNDVFFAGVSGLGYMNTQVYAGRFAEADRRRIWKDYVRLTDRYCRAAGMDGIELYNGSWGEITPPDGETFTRFAKGMKRLNYILADLGRHECVKPETANNLVGDTAVFHTLTRFQVWSASNETRRNDMANANAWLLDEIAANTPPRRPAFMSAMAISWYYYPAWLRDLSARLPAGYVLVRPDVLAHLFRQATR